MLVFALTTFLSAFLLFSVQPLIAKQIVPWFGGTSAVWTLCLVFFQTLLTAGYAYSDWTTRTLGTRSQTAVHLTLLAASTVSLPIIVGPGWKPTGAEEPSWRILLLLTATIGLPYLMLSTTSPLMQAWCARLFPERSVYRLFALSNLASLAALIAYPFAIEPWVTTRVQAYAWSVGYGAFAILCATAAVVSHRRAVSAAPPVTDTATTEPVEDVPQEEARLPYVLWLALPAMGSWLLLAVTNHLTQNVASIPFLWLLPLVLYLATFIISFDHERWYKRWIVVLPLFALLVACARELPDSDITPDIKLAIPLYGAALFVSCLFCHGELARLKPAPRYLTRFYLMLSLGAALGAVFVGVVAPRVFAGFWELGLGLTITGVVAAVALHRVWIGVPIAAIGVAGACGYYTTTEIRQYREDTRVLVRSFYGSLRTTDIGPPETPPVMRQLLNGVIIHGQQDLAPESRTLATSYYGATSGVGLALRALEQPGRRMAVIGLGAGTLAAYGRPGDVIRFYEINPQVIDLARREFTFLGDSPAAIEIAQGDARLSLEREPPQHFDLIAVDAFSGDAIPVHLLTREAFAIYLRHLNPGGVMAFHVTNHFLKLAPVVKQIAEAQGLASTLIADSTDNFDEYKSDWVLVTRDRGWLEREEIADWSSPIDQIPHLRAWTDDYNNLFQILQ